MEWARFLSEFLKLLLNANSLDDLEHIEAQNLAQRPLLSHGEMSVICTSPKQGDRNTYMFLW